MRKWELSLLLGIVVTLLWCAAAPGWTTHWWTTAFSPLCDGILSGAADGGGIVLRSRIWELLSEYVL